MNIILLLFIAIVIAIIAGFGIAIEHMGRRAQRIADAHADRYEPRHDRTDPRTTPLDPFSWAATEAIVDGERERLATTGELRELYQRPYPGGLSETGELRALAEAGDLGGVQDILGRWAAENLTEGEAA
jgi:hypothetical protein